MQRPFDTDAYRYPNERLILAGTILLVLLIIAVTATATLCGSVLFVGAMIALSAFAGASKHNQLMSQARQVTEQTTPALAALVNDTLARLRPGPTQIFIAPANVLNAYTFGLSSPKVVVLYAGLLQVMDPGELKFIIGHELGHVRLGHTWLNSLVGGMAGIPSPFLASILLRSTFLGWNRACEYSADRAGLLACGNLQKAVSALIKLGSGGRSTAVDHQRVMQPLSGEDAFVENFGELFATHPGIQRRVEALRRYAATSDYQRLQKLIDGNSLHGK